MSRWLRQLAIGAMALPLALAVHPRDAGAVLPTPGNCQNDVNGANDQPGQKDVTRFCVDVGVSPYELFTLAGWDETTLNGNNTADVCTLFNTDGDAFANLAVCTTLKSSGAGNGNLAILSQIRLFTCNNTRADRCPGSVLVAGPYVTTCEVSGLPPV